MAQSASGGTTGSTTGSIGGTTGSIGGVSAIIIGVGGGIGGASDQGVGDQGMKAAEETHWDDNAIGVCAGFFLGVR